VWKFIHNYRSDKKGKGQERSGGRRRPSLLDERRSEWEHAMDLTKRTKQVYGKAAQENVLREWYYTGGLCETVRIHVETQRNARPELFVPSVLFEALKAVASDCDALL
jgi:hypothetical protein